MAKSPEWPRLFPLYTMLGIAAGLVSGIAVLAHWKTVHQQEWFYLPTYIRLSVWAGKKAALFTMLGPKGVRLREWLLPAGVLAWIRETVYGGQDLTDVFRVPLWSTAVTCVVGFVVGAVFDARYNAKARKGRLLRGPEIVSVRQFNRGADGIRIQMEAGPAIRIRADREAHHIQIGGDTGAGKTSLIRDLMYQIEARGDTAIVFDPDREFVREFYSEERGDWILNPKDERCPYWPIGEEAADEAEATAIAVGMFPDGPTAGKFFQTHARAIMAYLLAVHRPTPEQLCQWMANERDLDARLVDTEHAGTIRENAAGQRQGILGELNIFAKPLRMMPDPDGRRVWLAKEWAQNRRGWIFITSTPETLDALRPLQTLWIDMLILKLQNTSANPQRVWMILDEIAALNQLPQLHSALTRQRKSGNPIILGFQGMSQVEYLYGDKMAQTILSQAFTNIILRTRESRAAEHMSHLIGKQEIERIREQRPAFSLLGWKGRSYNTEKVIVPAVMDSEIQGLDDLRGYLVQGGKVVKIQFRPRPKRIMSKAFVERLIPVVMRAGDPVAAPLATVPARRPRRAPRPDWEEENRQQELPI